MRFGAKISQNTEKIVVGAAVRTASTTVFAFSGVRNAGCFLGFFAQQRVRQTYG